MTRTPRPCAPSYRRLAAGHRRRRRDARSGIHRSASRRQAASATPSTTSTAIAAEATQALDRWRAGRPRQRRATTRRTCGLARRRPSRPPPSWVVPADDLDAAWGDVERRQAARRCCRRSRSSGCRTGRGCPGGAWLRLLRAGAVRLLRSRHRAAAVERRPDPGRHRGRHSPTPSRATSCTTRATSACIWGADLMVHSPQSGQDVEVRHLFDRSLRFGEAVPETPDRLSAANELGGSDRCRHGVTASRGRCAGR